MSSENLPTPLSRADYETIEAAVMETERGRWFLAEYARRNRHADTERILDAIARIQKSLITEECSGRLERMRTGLMEMARAIAVTHVEIGRIQPQGLTSSRLYEATGELDAIVRATEDATTTILSATEQVQEHAWTLRERGVPETSCDALDACATEIYAACGFQDVTAQRTRKVIDTLSFVENRIKSMMLAWDIDIPTAECPGGSPAPDHLWPADSASQQAVDATLRRTPAPATQPSGPALSDLDSLDPESRLRHFL